MSYTSWEQIREYNRSKYGIDYPLQPEDYRNTKTMSNIERYSIAFVRELCEELRFDRTKMSCEDRDGNGISPNLIPYNMEKDNDRLCLERAIHRFMQSGTVEDAFDIYFCYLEMFVGKYGKSKKMIEMLAEFEMNASALLMKHRDHYSHSVYVFLLGLAIYYQSGNFRKAYQNEYGFADEKESACHYLQYWGLSSLFHDIGYPFELPFEQVKSYFNNSIKDVPFVSYQGVADYIKLSSKESEVWAEILDDPKSENINALFANRMAAKLENTYQKSAETIRSVMLDRKPSSPDAFGGFMDHAYFSGIVLYRQLISVIGLEELTKDKQTAASYLDAMTAITLHNSLFKFGITNIKKEHTPFPMFLHPLAYMLMLCDELQCWDRTSYGQNSRQQLHPLGCDLIFDQQNPNAVTAVYAYDKRFEAKKERMKGTYAKMVSPSEESSEFLQDIEAIMEIDADRAVGLSIRTEFIENTKERNIYLSNSNYVHLYNFAITVHGRNKYEEAKVGDENFFAELEEYFDRLPLEYKMSVISRTKKYAEYLDRIGYFYTDRNVGYEMIDCDAFTEEEAAIIGELEHERWNEEKLEMGWHQDAKYRSPEYDAALSKELRECTRTHYEIGVPYAQLPESEQAKDVEPLQKMVKLLEEYDGLRIYKLPAAKKR